MKNLFTLILITIILSSCTSARISRKFSSGQIGCTEDEIQIANESASIEGMHNWVAICQGVKYVCTYHYQDGAKCIEAKNQSLQLEDVE